MHCLKKTLALFFWSHTDSPAKVQHFFKIKTRKTKKMENGNIKGKCKQCRYYNINHCMLSIQCNGQYFLKKYGRCAHRPNTPQCKDAQWCVSPIPKLNNHP